MSTPEPELDPRELRLAEALAEFADCEARGETVEIEAYCQARPDLQPELEDQLRTIARVSGESTLTHPEALSGYRILDQIGAGGMGRVFLAMDEGLGRRVAIKTLASRYCNDSQLRTRFMQEARSMARLNHSNIVRIYNLGQVHEIPHFVMEYVDGVPLTDACRSLTLRQRTEMVHKIALAVDFLHRNDVIHRDLKPGNILVGADLEPKLLDFGLALHLGDRKRLTLAGVVVGTPQYFSPEQARSDAELDARSDVFSLGTVFYELLTGVSPFRGSTMDEEIKAICEADPVLPRRVQPSIPGELQNICMKALEKDPANRYGSAREFAEDLGRYLSGEQPFAAPPSYARLLAGKVAQHLRELDGWKQDQIVSDEEYRSLRKAYGHLIEREDAWIMEERRLTLSQVTLYLGAWVSIVGAALIVLFEYADFKHALKVTVAAMATIPMLYLGIRSWNRGHFRHGIAYFLAFCFLLPITLLVTMSEYKIFAQVAEASADLEFFAGIFGDYFASITNAQLWWAFMLSLPVALGLRRFTRSSVFSMVAAVLTTLLSIVALLQAGLLRSLSEDKPSEIFVHLIPIALLFLAIGIIVEHLRHPTDSRFFYPVAVGFVWIALSGLAATHDGYLQSVNWWWSGIRMQRAYLFLVNAGLYFILQGICERLPWAQLQAVGRTFRFMIPLHVLLPVLDLGISATALWTGEHPNPAFKLEARTFEVLLPCLSLVFIFLSISRQMKNFFVWGMLFLAIGIVRLQDDIFKNQRAWLISLVVGGFCTMLVATHYSGLRMAVSRWTRRTP